MELSINKIKKILLVLNKKFLKLETITTDTAYKFSKMSQGEASWKI